MKNLFKPSIALPVINGSGGIVAVSLIAALANAPYAFNIFIGSVIFLFSYLIIGVFFFSE